MFFFFAYYFQTITKIADKKKLSEIMAFRSTIIMYSEYQKIYILRDVHYFVKMSSNDGMSYQILHTL